MSAFLVRLVALFAFALPIGPALADSWNVTRLRGEVLQLVEGEWQALSRGGSVPDERVIRTMGSGRLSLTRGDETIELGPNTQIRIFDRGGEKPFTTVQQEFGTVSVEAEVQQVQHFAVQTPFLAAVVKGTRFTVTSGKSGASVKVQRGHVSVNDRARDTTTILSAGQQANVKIDANMTVSGSGELPAVVLKGSIEAAVAMAFLSAEDRMAAALASGDKKQIEKATKELKKAAEDAAKVADRAAKEDKKAAEDAAKAQKKAAEDAAKAAEKAAKDAAKVEKDASKKDASKGKGKS